MNIISEMIQRRFSKKSGNRIGDVKNSAYGYARCKLVIDKNGNPVNYIFLEINKMFELLTGLKKGNVIGKNVTEAIPGIENDSGNWIERYGKMTLDKTHLSFEQFSEALGRWYSVFAYSNKKNQFVIFFTDRTESVILTEKIKDSEAKYKTLFEHVNDSIIIFDKNTFKIIEANQSSYRMYDYEENELIGQSYKQLCDNKEKFEKTNKSLNGEDVYKSYNTLHKKRDGSLFPVEVGIHSMTLKEKNFRFVVTKDISAFKKNEHDLKERVKELSCLYDISEIIEKEIDLNIIFQKIVERIPPGWQYPELTVAIIIHGINQYKTEDFERTLWGMNNNIVINEIEVGNVEVYYKEDLKFLPEEYVLLNEISERLGRVIEQKNLEDKINQSSKMEAIGQLAGGVAHDFNNMLTIIGGYSDILLENQNLDKRATASVQIIKDTVKRASKLTSQLLSFGRKQVLQLSHFSLNDLIDNSKHLFNKVINENIQLEYSLEENIWNTEADDTKIQQVLINLIINARDAIKEKGVITIETSNLQIDNIWYLDASLEPGPYVSVKIIDTGHGIDVKILKKIFDPFFTTKSKDKGTGLGLSTAYGIIKQLKGSITVKSKLNEGTVFTIVLPRSYSEKTEKIELLESIESSKNQGHREKILLIEDEDPVRKVVEEMLISNGYDVVSADSGEQALKIVSNCQDSHCNIDIIVTDIIMSGMNGKQTVEEIKKSCSYSHKAIYMSGYTSDVIKESNFLEEGINFIQKPLNFNILLRMIKKVLMDG